MHFWIDKRSPQCGFGRSRVAASLHTGGSGLSFGHPPRRSLGHKSSSSSSANTAHVAANQTGVQVHRQPQQQYHGHTATTSTAAQYRSGGSGSLTTSNNNNNSNTANNHATNRNFNRSAAGTSTHHYYNNNRQQQLAAAAAAAGGSHHHHHHAPNSSNNNHNGTAQTLLSPTGNNLNCTPLNNATLAAATTAATTTVGATTYQTQIHSMHLQQQQQQQHAQRYRHPQFGNMSVRTMQPPQPPPQMNIVTATTTTPLQTLQQQQTTTNTNTDTTAAAVLNYNSNSILMTNTTATTATTGASSTSAITANQLQQQQQQQQQQSLDASLNTLNEHGIHHQQQLQHPHQSPNQTANLSAELYQTSPRIVTTFNRPLTTTTTLTPGICDHSSNLSVNQRTTYTNSTLTTMTTNNGQHHLHHQQQQQHTRHVRRTNRSIESTDLQFLPLHLKCGIFASLVLAIAFIVGIKVYFDNHGTKFEVGLFWLLTATFVFAFCFVSICKVPRVLFASASTSRSNSRDQTRDRCSMDEVAAANEANARGSMVNSIDDVVISGLHEFQQQEQIQSININAQAGPPPYHIAILLPETKAKEDISTMEESPPPSYDKILI